MDRPVFGDPNVEFRKGKRKKNKLHKNKAY